MLHEINICNNTFKYDAFGALYLVIASFFFIFKVEVTPFDRQRKLHKEIKDIVEKELFKSKCNVTAIKPYTSFFRLVFNTFDAL